MNEITNFPEAKLYISKRYVFDAEHYFTIGKLNQKEWSIFIIKHCVLEVYEKMYTFLTEVEKILYDISIDIDYRLIECSAGIMMNILKLAEVAHVDLELHYEVWHFRTEYKEVLKHAAKIATECKKFDRTNKYNAETMQTAVEQLWHQFIKILNFEKLLFYEEMYKVIGIII
jgi:hypothetical protein